jgi:hypothetical protein
VTATGGQNQARITWTASTDNVGVTRYNVHRGSTAGFAASASNRIAQPTGTSYTDTGRPAGDYWYRVTAQDAAGNVSGASAAVKATVTADTIPPSVSLTSPAGGAILSGTVPVTAAASDDTGVAGVQFLLDGQDLGAEDVGSPYGVSWDTTTASEGPHTLTVVARDAAGNRSTSAPVSVTVLNVPVLPPPLPPPSQPSQPPPDPTQTPPSRAHGKKRPKTQTTARLVTAASVDPGRVCKQVRTRCYSKARLRFRLSRRAHVKIVFTKVGRSGGRRLLARKMLGRAGWNVAWFSARRLPAGHYRIRIVAVARRTAAPGQAHLRVA